MVAPRKKLAKIKDEINYYDHQIIGVRQMVRMTSFLLADDMGLGKSLQALTVAAVALHMKEAKRILVVVPASLKENWQDELDIFGEGYTGHVLDGTPKQREKQLAEFDKDVLIINYEQVTAHVDTLNAMKFGITIYDEAHYIKSRKSIRTKACFRLTQPRHFLLTGSPLLNQVDDLWALLHRISPRDWPNYWTFVNRYAVFGGYADKQIVGIKNEAELRERLGKVMIRREKDDCLDLPKKQIVQVKVTMLPDQKKLYDQAHDEMQMDNPNDLTTPFEIENGLTKLLRLKQICGTTATIPGHPDHSSKLDKAVEMCQEIIGNGEPVVVFTQFRKVLECMEQRLDAVGIQHVALHGDIKISDRQGVVKAWGESAKNKQPKVILCMWQVAGIGLNMTAASKCIAIDKLYVPKLNDQGYDRLHRIGQTETVQIFELLMRGTIETRIEQILKMKKGIFGAVIDPDKSDWKKRLIQAVINDEDDGT